ncbi:hypothetical protein BS101_03295 [Clostridium kluyveri]|uniref:Uncharacterized protein n=2 Tax=Clostridium kluyveri TaxID=1534 RepID=A0A1L5F4R9_CLOKL|nr:hypothetical protein BS101_03295 [Clostridium kluyveri]
MFLSMFLISVLAKPIVFRRKPPAGIVYGLAAAICFLLFFIFQYVDYSSQQAYFKDQIERLTTSNWQPPRVSGNVTAVNSTTANSTGTHYINIPMPQNQNLKDALTALQNDLNTLQNGINSGKTTAKQLVNNQITAFLDNYGPIQNSTINLTVMGLPGTSVTPGTNVTVVCHYDKTDSTYTGTIASNGRAVIPIKIGKATPGYQVNVDVTAGNANTRTSFRVQ